MMKTKDELFGFIKVGRLNKPIADKIGRKPADIYIDHQHVRHILNKHAKELKISAEAGIIEYVKGIIKNCNLICEGDAGALMLLYNQPNRLDVSVIELIQFNPKLNIYQVKTANRRHKEILSHRVILWIK